MTITRKMYAIYDAGTGWVKIGFSGHPGSRLADLRSHAMRSLILLAEVPGGREREQATHKYLADERVKSEWFVQSPRLWALIHELRIEQAWLEAIQSKPRQTWASLEAQASVLAEQELMGTVA